MKKEQPSVWIALSGALALISICLAVWGWWSFGAIEKERREASAAAFNARAEKAEINARLASAEENVKTLQGIVDQMTALQDRQARAYSSELSAHARSTAQPHPVPAPSYVAPVAPAPALAEPANPPVRIFSEAVSVVELMSDYVKWSWKAKLSNPGSVAMRGMVRCELLDRSGFRLDQATDYITIQPRQTLDLTGEGMTQNDVWERYKKHRFSFD